MSAWEELYYPPLELPPPGREPTWWPVNRAQQAAVNSRAELLLMGGQSGGGKGLDVNTPIPTPDGWKLMGDLAVGDRVFGADGKPCNVTFVSDVHYRECFCVSFEDGSVLIADDEHNWKTLSYVERRQGDRKTEEWRAARRAKRASRANPNPKFPKRQQHVIILNRNRVHEYQPPPDGAVRSTIEVRDTLLHCGEHLNHCIPVCRPIETPEATLPIDPYTLGVWLGDGAASDGSVGMMESDFAEIVTYIPYEVMSRKIELAGQRGYKHNFELIRFRTLRARLRALGVLCNKHIPPAYLRASIEQRKELLRGLLDTDGYPCSRGMIEVAFSDEGLAKDALELILSLGIKAAIAVHKTRCRDSLRMKFVAPFPAFRLVRKLARQKLEGFRDTTTRRYVKAVVPHPTVPTRCIQVDSPDNLYLAGRALIPTHNTSYLAADAAMEFKNPRLRALLLRTTLEEMQELEDIQQRMYEPKGARWKRRRSVAAWVFPSGAMIRPGYLAHDKHLKRYQGNPYSWLGIDEIGQHPENRVRFMIGWLAAPIGTGLRVRGRFTANPGGVGHSFMMKVFLRNRCPVHFPADFKDDRPWETSVYPGRVYRGACWTDDSPVHKTTAFIPARLADNPLYGREKLESLLSQSKAIQQQLLYGCWCNAAGLYFDFMRPDMVVPYASIGDSWWWQHFWSLDFGYGNSAAAAGMYAINPNGVVFRTRERVERKMSALKFAKCLCKDGFPKTEFPAQGPQESWNKKLKARDPEKPRMAFAVMDEAMDQHRGTGKSIYDIMAEVFAEHGIGSMKAAHDPAGNAQVLYNGLANKGLILTRDSADLSLGYRSLSSRIVDERKAIKKIHGAWEDDVYDECSYAYNTWRENSEKPARTALADELAQMRKDGMDETSIARIAWQRQKKIEADEKQKAKGIRLSRPLRA